MFWNNRSHVTTYLSLQFLSWDVLKKSLFVGQGKAGGIKVGFELISFHLEAIDHGDANLLLCNFYYNNKQ